MLMFSFSVGLKVLLVIRTAVFNTVMCSNESNQSSIVGSISGGGAGGH